MSNPWGNRLRSESSSAEPTAEELKGRAIQDLPHLGRVPFNLDFAEQGQVGSATSPDKCVGDTRARQLS